LRSRLGKPATLTYTAHSSSVYFILQAFSCLSYSSCLSRLAMSFLRIKRVMSVAATKKAMTKTTITPAFL
jgi:hypothetical protein